MLNIPVAGNYAYLIETCFCGTYDASLCEDDNMMLTRLAEELEACDGYEEADYSIRIVDLNTCEVIYTFHRKFSDENTSITEIYRSDAFKTIEAFYN